MIKNKSYSIGDVFDNFFDNCNNMFSSENYTLTTAGDSAIINYKDVVGHYDRYDYYPPIPTYPLWDTWTTWSFPEVDVPKFPLSNCHIDKEGTVILELALAGYTKKELTVNRNGEKLTIEGKKLKDTDEEKEVWKNFSTKDFIFSKAG